MKVERINDVQIKFILTKTDLEKRSLDITDLAYGSTKTQELFQDIIDTADREFSFNVEERPLMIEAVPMSKSSITIQLTKVNKDDHCLPTLAEGLLKKIEDVPHQNSCDDEETMIKIRNKNKVTDSKNKKIEAMPKCFIYSFDNLDLISESARMLSNTNADSSIYKFKNDYMVIVDSVDEKQDNMKMINRVFSEHGKKMNGKSELLKAYLVENGEKIIGNNAISIMAKL